MAPKTEHKIFSALASVVLLMTIAGLLFYAGFCCGQSTATRAVLAALQSAAA